MHILGLERSQKLSITALSQPLLLDAFEQTEPRTQVVITRYRNAASNLRTQRGRIIGKDKVDNGQGGAKSGAVHSGIGWNPQVSIIPRE